MILTVTLNFALDVTYGLEHFERGETARVKDVSRQAGGKGVNVARVLDALGREAAVTGLVGGPTGRAARDELRHAALRDELVEIEDDSRLTVMVVEADGQATGFSEPGAELSPEEWKRFRERFASLLAEAEAVVLSGSLPRGAPAAAYAELVFAASSAGVPVLVDADGEALQRAVATGPEIVKVNAAELAGVVGTGEVLDGARQLIGAGAGAVVVSCGADGLTCLAETLALHAAPPRQLTGNPTGAGDAASAALIAGLLDGLPWPERLVEAAALSAAAVCAPLAGRFDAQTYRELRRQVTVRALSAR